ncbi:hypothetical protein [Sinomicrobium weinanense]|uniref:Secreted protein n=1 Tax=Sinomicrobium weinanense TaxID=2842200 RepID=A0A926JV75_9FLAO|nr:hypothetical protein [Sinomicrobium weinanense]MBC9797808.1 hypothetical protein [Sinomicrobium weinanense]MBU3125957.1 hypothetical protein [Sinomicrobium weinanense]
MKKIIGVFGIIALALGMFLSTNTTAKVSSDLNLNSLISLNPAEAACPESNSSSANAKCTASNNCLYDTSARECHL